MTDFTGLPNLVIGDVIDPLSQCLIGEYEADTGQTIIKGDAVALSADGKISRATSAAMAIGIATKGAAAGEKCSVIVRGRVKVATGGAIARGQRVYAGDAAARVLALTDQAVDEGGTAKYTIYYSRAFAFAEQSAAAAGDLISIIVGR